MKAVTLRIKSKINSASDQKRLSCHTKVDYGMEPQTKDHGDQKVFKFIKTFDKITLCHPIFITSGLPRLEN